MIPGSANESVSEYHLDPPSAERIREELIEQLYSQSRAALIATLVSSMVLVGALRQVVPVAHLLI